MTNAEKTKWYMQGKCPNCATPAAQFTSAPARDLLTITKRCPFCTLTLSVVDLPLGLGNLLTVGQVVAEPPNYAGRAG